MDTTQPRFSAAPDFPAMPTHLALAAAALKEAVPLRQAIPDELRTQSQERQPLESWPGG